MDRSFHVRSIHNDAGPGHKQAITWIHGNIYLLYPLWREISRQDPTFFSPDRSIELLALRRLYEHVVLNPDNRQSIENVSSFSSTLHVFTSRTGLNPTFESVSKDMLGLLNRFGKPTNNPGSLCIASTLTSNPANGTFVNKADNIIINQRYEFIHVHLVDFNVDSSMSNIFSTPFKITIQEEMDDTKTEVANYNVVSILTRHGGVYLHVDGKFIHGFNGETIEDPSKAALSKPEYLLLHLSSVI